MTADHPNSRRTILIVEDEREIQDVVRCAVEQEGWRAVTAGAVAEGLKMFRAEKPDAVILDLVLPGGNGFDFLREMRKTSRAPVVILSSRDDEADIVTGLELGADDYVKKPFSARELMARLRAVMRRASGKADTGRSLRRDNLRIEVDRHEVFWKERPIRLTVSEFYILTALAEAPDRLHSREALLHAVHGFTPASSERVVDVHVKEIRRKFRSVENDADLIETVPLAGYRLRRIDSA